jgi:hypothetical protein
MYVEVFQRGKGRQGQRKIMWYTYVISGSIHESTQDQVLYCTGRVVNNCVCRLLWTKYPVCRVILPRTWFAVIHKDKMSHNPFSLMKPDSPLAAMVLECTRGTCIVCIAFLLSCSFPEEFLVVFCLPSNLRPLPPLHGPSVTAQPNINTTKVSECQNAI